MTRRPRIRWRARERSVTERGLVFFGRRRLSLADDIDIDSPAAEQTLVDLLAPPAPAGGWHAITLWLHPSGHNRPPFETLRGPHDPREAFVRCEAHAGDEADRDVVEARVRWPEGGGAPTVVTRHHRPGRLTAARAARPLRERLDALRPRVRGRELVWRAETGPTLWLRADRALLALAETLATLDDERREELAALCDALEASAGTQPAAALELVEPAPERPDCWRWLVPLAGRRRSLRRSLLRARCPRCDAVHPAAAWRESAYDRREEVAGDAGLVLHCPRDHAVFVCFD
ncbi:MAG: hypothetical protein D6776_11440 [Planctomycetota bacterium]|nr:MAG: hypothetical protein D6776_11440 [Planctomycetota bacterium]